MCKTAKPNRELPLLFFHELLHNLGFGHTSNNDLSSQKSFYAILAMEDCMNQEAKKKSAAF
jgi:ssRNA-specific RNase YbeY (16S rRNA maturation enzyme)